MLDSADAVESDSAAVAQFKAPPPKNYARFYRKWKRNNFQSQAQGVEVGEWLDYVMIISPGQSKTEVHRIVTERDKAEHPVEWQAYASGKEQASTGTPINLLPGIDDGRADAFKTQYVMTIEQLAELSDMGVQKCGMGAAEMRERARKYLRSKEYSEARLGELAGEVDKLRAENLQLREERDALRLQVNDLLKHTATPKRKPTKGQTGGKRTKESRRGAA